MNWKLVFKVLGRVELVVMAAMTLPLACALLYREDPTPFLYSMGIIACISLPLSFLPTKSSSFFLREGFATVGLIWLFTGVVGGLPFFFDGGGGFNTIWDCIFEASSGFTTTGATILTDIESLPQGILLWRAFTHWLGGMGILVLATALLPSMGIRSHYLAQAESPGPVFSKLVPKQSQTSKILYSIYCVMTAVEVALLKLAGMPFYDALVHAFSTAGTGGFSNRAASVGAYDSAVIDVIIGMFCLLFSVNFALYFLVQKRVWEALKSDELRFFLIVVALATVGIAVDILPQYGSILQSLRYSFFQVASIISTTGFATADYVLWPHLSQYILILLMFCGACAGSTGGGVKCSRMLVLLRTIRREIHQIVHPRSVEVVRLEGKVVDEDTLRTILAFVGCYVLVLLGAGLVVSLDDVSFDVSFSAALTCLSNVGPGLAEIGPVGSFANFSPLSKVVLSVTMIAGRLELFPILILFSPRTWSRS